MMIGKFLRSGNQPGGARLEREGARQLTSVVDKAGGLTHVPTDVLERLHSGRSLLVRQGTAIELIRRSLEDSRKKSGMAAADDIERSFLYIENAKKAGSLPSFFELDALDELFSRRTADLSFSDWKAQGMPVVGILDTELLNRVVGAHAKNVYLHPGGSRNKLLFWLDFERSFNRGEIAIRAPTQTHQ